MHCSRIVFGLGVAVIVLTGRVDAGTVTFTDLDAFLAAAGNVQLIDFETLPDGSPSFSGAEITPDFNYTDQGVTFSPGAGTLVIRQRGSVPGDTFDLGAFLDSMTRNWIVADLLVPAFAVGIVSPGSTALEVFDIDGNSLASARGGGSGIGFFLGIVSDVPIVRAVSNEGRSFGSFQDFYFTPIPEPATVLLVAIGSVGITRKRQL